MKVAIAALSGLTISGISMGVYVPRAIAQMFIEIPKSNFFPQSITNPTPTTPPKPLSNTATDLQKETNPVPDPTKSKLAEESEQKKLSPLQRPLFRLFGFETAYTLKQQELVFQISGTSFNNPFDFRGDSNRSNDTNVGFTYGITDNLQISINAAGKDDTIFTNFVRPDSALEFFYGNIPVTLKYKYLDEQNLAAAVVFSTEFSSPVPGLFTRGGRNVIFTTPGPRTSIMGITTLGAIDEFQAVDDTPYFSLAFPLAYKVNDQLVLNLNPQVSFFPSSIAAKTTFGSTSNLVNQRVGFNGDRLDYYGTVAGIGFGVNYMITPKLQFAADFTPIFSGKNSAGIAEDSLFVRRSVWNIGLQYAPNSRTAASIYATNRFGPTASSPSNLLVQPNGDYAIGALFTFLPDINGNYAIEKRESYPKADAFFTNLNGLPSAVLPINSILYQLALGTNGRFNPTIRLGILDDLELALNVSNNNVDVIPIENSIMGRLALVQDEGKDFSYSSALGIGLILNGARDRQLENAVSLYFDLPTSYRLEGRGIDLKITPKLILPAQFQGISTIFAITVGGSVKVAENTQILAEYTPIISGSNQIQTSFTSSGFQTFPISGKTGIYNIGLRQLIPNGNSVYAIDLYFTNSSSDYGLQGISALASGGTQFGLRFNILNGVPESRKTN